MKKSLSILTAIIGIFLLYSCNTGSPIERKAKQSLRKLIEETARNPKEFDILKEKVAYSNDSICIITFIGRGENGMGGKSVADYEYTLIKDNKEVKYSEVLLDLDDDDSARRSLSAYIKKCDEGTLDDNLKEPLDKLMDEKKMTKEQAKAFMVYVYATVNCIMNGQEVEAE